MTGTAVQNGHASVAMAHVTTDFDEQNETMRERIEDHVADLRRMLADELKVRDRLQEYLDESKARERRLQRAVTALSDDPAPAKPQPTSKPKSSRPVHEWDVSEERIAFVRDRFVAFMADRTEPITKTEFGSILKERGEGISSETLAKAFEQLRSREVVRLAGHTRGGGKLWLLMPDGGEDAA